MEYDIHMKSPEKDKPQIDTDEIITIVLPIINSDSK